MPLLVPRDVRHPRHQRPLICRWSLSWDAGETAESEPDEERKAAAYLGDAGRDLAVEAGATVINR